jgi:AGCS family alanine or glycine:cation symporter
VRTTLLAGGIDDAVNENFETVSTEIQKVIFYSVKINGVDFPIVVGWLALAAIVFTIYFRGINFRGFKHAIQLVKGDYTRPDEVGEVSHFQALATAVSGRSGSATSPVWPSPSRSAAPARRSG